jgi:hypothetical protein
MASTRRRRWAVGGLLLIQGTALAASCSEDLGDQDCILLATTLGRVRQVACDGGDAGFGVACLLDASCYDATAFCADPGAATLPGACVEQLQL